MLSFVCLFAAFLLRTLLLTRLAKNIYFVVEEVLDSPMVVLCLYFLFTTAGARYRLAGLARLRAIAESVFDFHRVQRAHRNEPLQALQYSLSCTFLFFCADLS